MSPSNRLTACIFVLIAVFSSCSANIVGKYDNAVVRLYSKTYYRDPLLTLNVSTPNKCFDLDCTALSDKVESAKWSGLPSTGIGGKAYIIFYEDGGCEGKKATITLPHFGGIRDFDVQKVKGKISSFKLLTQLSTDNGVALVCLWAGANVVGGTVSEDGTIVGSVPKPE